MHTEYLKDLRWLLSLVSGTIRAPFKVEIAASANAWNIHEAGFPAVKYPAPVRRTKMLLLNYCDLALMIFSGNGRPKGTPVIIRNCILDILFRRHSL